MTKPKEPSSNGTATADTPFSQPNPDRGTNPFHALPAEPPPILLAAAFEAAGLPEAVTARFRAKSLFSVTDVEEWLSRPCDNEPEAGPPRRNHLTDIPGIGPLAATRINQVLFAAKASREPENRERPPLPNLSPQEAAACLEKLRELDGQWATQDTKIAALNRQLKTEKETLSAVISQHRETARKLVTPPEKPEPSLFDHIENGSTKP
jgi:hypothetical protein